MSHHAGRLGRTATAGVLFPRSRLGEHVPQRDGSPGAPSLPVAWGSDPSSAVVSAAGDCGSLACPQSLGRTRTPLRWFAGAAGPQALPAAGANAYPIAMVRQGNGLHPTPVVWTRGLQTAGLQLTRWLAPQAGCPPTGALPPARTATAAPSPAVAWANGDRGRFLSSAVAWANAYPSAMVRRGERVPQCDGSPGRWALPAPREELRPARGTARRARRDRFRPRAGARSSRFFGTLR